MASPINPTTHEAVHSAVANVTTAFQDLAAELDATGTSVAVKSIHEAAPLLELHTPAQLNTNGSTTIDSQTTYLGIYRLGIISKIFAVLSLLQQKQVRWDDPIIDYVPELLQLKRETDEISDIATVRWSDVTLGSLASHMSSIGTDHNFPVDWSRVGFPKLDDTSKPGCAGVLGLPPCNRTELFRDFGKRHLVYAPFTNPVYSNVASVILGFALEAITNMTYDSYVRQSIFAPLNMTHNHNLPCRAGGFYSNTVDLLSFGVGILKYTVLDGAKTRKWMKPASSTSSSGLLIGGLWETPRSSAVTKDKRLVEFYCKAGNLNTYNNILCLIPDYDLVITILSGGSQSNADLVDLILTKIVQGLLPAIEDAGKAEAKLKFGSSYADATSNPTITILLDDAPGFAVSDWVIHDVDVIKNYGSFATLSSSPKDQVVSVRLYPTNLGSECHTAWRAVFDVGSPEDIATKEANSFWPDASCHTWGSMDRLTYGF
ncbi:beta-lactamase/transpeptidase-like protein [Hypoxylon cercidicola]|nr:beta-lactamase/transpeptidase-like protein [Hypoxylon cercidicola]